MIQRENVSKHLLTNLESTMSDQDKFRSSRGTRQKIIAAAAEVGSKVGYSKATTRAIAEAAGVNEVTLFRHFGSKENLFSAAIEAYGGPALVPVLESQFTGDLQADLTTVGSFFFGILAERREMLRLLLCESAYIPEVRTVLARNPRELRQMLARYLEHQMKLGTVRAGHPEAMAQAFLGMFFSYAISLNILDEKLSPGINQEDLISQFVEIFISGTLAE
jgi:AcrR family transcriptional regulator